MKRGVIHGTGGNVAAREKQEPAHAQPDIAGEETDGREPREAGPADRPPGDVVDEKPESHEEHPCPGDSRPRVRKCARQRHAAEIDPDERLERRLRARGRIEEPGQLQPLPRDREDEVRTPPVDDQVNGLAEQPEDVSDEPAPGPDTHDDGMEGRLDADDDGEDPNQAQGRENNEGGPGPLGKAGNESQRPQAGEKRNGVRPCPLESHGPLETDDRSQEA